MSDTGEICHKSLNLLLFSVGGVFFGMDADQISEMVAYTGEKADDLFWFHEKIGFGDKAVTYNLPTVVTIRTGGESPYRVVIDSMEDIAEFSQNDISLLPPLLEPFFLRRGIWGILPLNGNMILLLDFKLMSREIRRSTDSKSE